MRINLKMIFLVLAFSIYVFEHILDYFFDDL